MKKAKMAGVFNHFGKAFPVESTLCQQPYSFTDDEKRLMVYGFFRGNKGDRRLQTEWRHRRFVRFSLVGPLDKLKPEINIPRDALQDSDVFFRVGIRSFLNTLRDGDKEERAERKKSN